MKIGALRGFREFYPEEMAARRAVIDRMAACARSFGFREVDHPSVEPLDLLKLKSGDDIAQELFSFADKGGREVTLIPETTPSLARMVGARKDLQKPLKWFTFGKLWRYEEPQAGRLREFYQMNVDIFGATGVEADAELIAMSVALLRDLGLGGEFAIKISDRRLLSEALAGTDVQQAFRIIDKSAKVGDAEVRRQMEELGISAQKIDSLLQIIHFSGNDVKELRALLPQTAAVSDACDRLEQLFSLLEAYGVADACTLDLSIVRGLAYYTGMVFECHDTAGDLRAIFGGGRYDELVGLFGGEKTPAVGFAVGDAVLEILMRRGGKWPEEKLKTDYYIINTDQKHVPLCIKILQGLRGKGFSADWDLLGRKVGAQMKQADRAGAAKCIILGDSELEKGMVLVRDMKSGEQKEEKLAIFVPGQ